MEFLFLEGNRNKQVKCMLCWCKCGGSIDQGKKIKGVLGITANLNRVAR